NAMNTVHVSAMRGIGLDGLLERIDELLEGDPVRTVHLRIPQSEGKVLATIEGSARVYSRKYKDGMVELEAQVPESIVRKVGKFVVE
ncbi:MAG TPA: GTPase HflX, partial [Terriglobales bacterium]